VPLAVTTNLHRISSCLLHGCGNKHAGMLNEGTARNTSRRKSWCQDISRLGEKQTPSEHLPQSEGRTGEKKVILRRNLLGTDPESTHIMHRRDWRTLRAIPGSHHDLRRVRRVATGCHRVAWAAACQWRAQSFAYLRTLSAPYSLPAWMTGGAGGGVFKS
jgi:hypothetical protein